MEKKQNKLLLASAVVGAFFVVVIIIAWIFAVSEIEFKEFYYVTPRNDTSVFTLVVLQLLMAIITFSFVFNMIGWFKGSKEHILIAGILYVLSFNLISAFLCLIVYPKKKRKIENKLLFYTMIYTSIFSVIAIALSILGSIGELKETFKEMLPFWIYFISTISTGIIFNYIAWKTGNNKAKIIAGIAYVLGFFTIISGVLCLISGRDLLKAIKNKLLFYAMAFALVWLAIMITAVLAGSEDGSTLAFWAYAILMGIAGFIINYFARITNNKKAKIIAGIVYIFGAFNIISAILCFISCKNNRKLPKLEENAVGSVDV
jgi:hypothetical protein